MTIINWDDVCGVTFDSGPIADRSGKLEHSIDPVHYHKECIERQDKDFVLAEVGHEHLIVKGDKPRGVADSDFICNLCGKPIKTGD